MKDIEGTNRAGERPASPDRSGTDRSLPRARVDAEHILNAAFDGTLDAAGHMKFAELLRADPKFRARWAHTARSLSRLRAEGPDPVDRTDAIMARVHEIRGFRTPPARRRFAGTRFALAAGLGIGLVGVAWFARTQERNTGLSAPLSRAPLSSRPEAPRQTETRPSVLRPPVLALENAERYDRAIDFSVKSRVDSPSGGSTSMRVFAVADGRVLLTDFEPYPHAQAWRENSGAELSWWVRAWTRAEPAWAGPVAEEK